VTDAARWESVVHIFELNEEPGSVRIYAWSSPIEGSGKRRFVVVPHMGAVRSPSDAVRAALIAGREASITE
jgi:hypothetical protein